MPKVGPKRTLAELQESAKVTSEGKGKPGLPGVKADAKQVDLEAYNANRKLAKEIQAVVKRVKTEKDKGKPRFLVAWRMYPNAENEYWNGKEHSCGCCCACS